MFTSVRIFSRVIVYVHIHAGSMLQLRTTSINFSFFACTLFSFHDSWISLECQPNNGSVRKYLAWAGLNLYIHILRCIRAHVKYTPVVYTRLFTHMSRRTTLNLPWIRVRMQRGRTGQLSIQVGQPRSSATYTDFSDLVIFVLIGIPIAPFKPYFEVSTKNRSSN